MNKKRFKIVLNAPATLSFVALCLIVTLIGVATGGKSTRFLFMTYRTKFTDLLLYVRMFTHVLGHLDMKQFLGSAAMLLLLGPLLEEKYGSRVIVEVVLITAFITSLVLLIFSPSVAVCGSSGVVFAFILLSSCAGLKDREIPITLILVAIIYLGQQIVDGITLRDNISQLAHVVGGVVGTGIGYMLNYNKKR